MTLTKNRIERWSFKFENILCLKIDVPSSHLTIYCDLKGVITRHLDTFQWCGITLIKFIFSLDLLLFTWEWSSMSKARSEQIRHLNTLPQFGYTINFLSGNLHSSQTKIISGDWSLSVSDRIPALNRSLVWSISLN